MDERIKKIADYYGYESQMDMLCEECGEFVQARNKLRRNVDGAYQNCLEEIADIAIMIEQMKLICGADRIEQIINDKLNRQIQRIKDESGPETDVIYQDDKVRAIKVTGWENDKKMDEYISKQKVIDYLNGYLHSLGEGGADDLLFNRGQRRALTNAIQDIIAVKPVNQWISVKDRLPEIGRSVLIYYPKWDGDEIQAAKLDGDGITFDICGEFNIGTRAITHWMPLPEPPKERDSK
jgi:NTP pyrophosphatase (non-canonical NTP hydrolase)